MLFKDNFCLTPSFLGIAMAPVSFLSGQTSSSFAISLPYLAVKMEKHLIKRVLKSFDKFSQNVIA